MNHSAKKDIYEKVTNTIIEMLEKGVVPWKKGWTGVKPCNLQKKPYRGTNALLTALVVMDKGYQDPRFLTFNAAKKLGGSVKKGEKGLQILFWKFIKKVDEDGKEKSFPIAKSYTVFNVEQCKGLEDAIELIQENPLPFNEGAEQIIENYQNTPRLKLSASDKACYRPRTDEIHLPNKELFHNEVEYYNTLFHEMIHSTGHPNRLNRFKKDEPLQSFGSESYGKEELIAELGACFLGMECQLPVTENNASYIQGWLKTIKGDTRLLSSAAQAAQKAVDLILGESQDQE